MCCHDVWVGYVYINHRQNDKVLELQQGERLFDSNSAPSPELINFPDDDITPYYAEDPSTEEEKRQGVGTEGLFVGIRTEV